VNWVARERERLVFLGCSHLIGSMQSASFGATFTIMSQDRFQICLVAYGD
jgi:hypothetical protein